MKDKKVFTTMGDGRQIKRFHGFRALIRSGEYEYFSKQENKMKSWEIEDDQGGQVEVQLCIDPNDDRDAYRAPELIRKTCYDLYSFERKEMDVEGAHGQINVLQMLRQLEGFGMAVFSSVSVTR